MEKKLRLYPSRTVKAQLFKGVKVNTLPNQSMSLKEVLRRFTRRESIPLAKDIFYEQRFGDLEKFQHEDIFVQEERIKELRAFGERIKKQEEERKKQKDPVPPKDPPPPATPAT